MTIYTAGVTITLSAEEAEALNGAQVTDSSQVYDFHKLYGHPIALVPGLVSRQLSDLRIKLIAEELKELIAAIGAGDLIEIADALGDLIYVVQGAALVYGIPLDDVVRAIHKSNLTKLGADGKPIISRGEELDGAPLGKVLKGPNYQTPTADIEAILVGVGWEKTNAFGMRYYRKRPITVQTIQWTGTDESANAIRAWSNDHDAPIIDTNDIQDLWDYDAGAYLLPDGYIHHAPYHVRCLVIKTREGNMVSKPGDWIVRGIENEYWSVKKSIFEATYEEVAL